MDNKYEKWVDESAELTEEELAAVLKRAEENQKWWSSPNTDPSTNQGTLTERMNKFWADCVEARRILTEKEDGEEGGYELSREESEAVLELWWASLSMAEKEALRKKWIKDDG